MTAATDTAPAPTVPAPAPIGAARLAIATAVAVALNLAVFLIGDLAGATWAIGEPYPVGVVMVVAATAVPMALAGVVVWFAARRRPALQRVAAWVGLAVALVTVPRAFMAAVDGTTAVSLALMHVVAGAAWVLALRPGAGGTRA